MADFTNFVQIKDITEWQKLLDRVLFKTFFHKLEWESFLEQEFKWLKFERYVYAPQGQQTALLSLARYKRGGKEQLISHPFCEYGGHLPLTQNIDILAFKQDLLKHFSLPLKLPLKLKISLHPHLSYYTTNSNVWKSDFQTLRRSYFIEDFDKKTKEEIWRSLRKIIRQEIKKAQVAGIEIKKCGTEKELKQFYNLYLGKAKQHKIPAYPFSFFQFFLSSPDVEIVLVEQRGRALAGSVFLKYSHCLHYFLNASSKQGTQKRANHLILWHQLGRYCGKGENGFKVFDFGGTKKGSSLEVFKQGWGAQAKPIYEIHSEPKQQKIQTNKFGLARKVWGLLPKKAIKILSPYFLKYKL